MWQVFYEDGSTIREDSGQDWADITKNGITAVRLSWELFDWIPYFREEFSYYNRIFQNPSQWLQIESLLEVAIQDYDTLRKAFYNSIGRTTAHFRKCEESIHDSIEKKYLEFKTLSFDGKTPQERGEANKKAIFLNGFLIKIKNLRSSIGSYQHQLDKSIILKREDKPVAFFQHKHHVVSATKSMGQIIDERVAQEVGMIQSRQGHYVSAIMHIKTGHFTLQTGNVHDIKLNLELHGIDLEVLP